MNLSPQSISVILPSPKRTSVCLPPKSLSGSLLTAHTAVLSSGQAFFKAVAKVRLAGNTLSTPIITAMLSPLARASRMMTLLSHPLPVYGSYGAILKLWNSLHSSPDTRFASSEHIAQLSAAITLCVADLYMPLTILLPSRLYTNCALLR